jgi:hypothetical protein
VTISQFGVKVGPLLREEISADRVNHFAQFPRLDKPWHRDIIRACFIKVLNIRE